jgi:hypothetical protein
MPAITLEPLSIGVAVMGFIPTVAAIANPERLGRAVSLLKEELRSLLLRNRLLLEKNSEQRYIIAILRKREMLPI